MVRYFNISATEVLIFVKLAMEKASSSAEKVESQVKQLSKQIDEIRNNAIGGMDTKLKELNKKISKAQADKTKLGVAISANERFVYFNFVRTYLICLWIKEHGKVKKQD
jgi:septal ring factor EnvC (AmiA/AmiB activator)